MLLVHDVSRLVTDNLDTILAELTKNGFAFVPIEYFLTSRSPL